MIQRPSQKENSIMDVSEKLRLSPKGGGVQYSIVVPLIICDNNITDYTLQSTCIELQSNKIILLLLN
ncbi:hypothetical protein EDL79_04080 [Ehrlichia ruminantium]|uniref:Uncharacterized protein n=1 Tax=Ehrlichia ruminantium TaxID=779 RepID=A0AAE6UIS1_EHRRU|nr:hypothetical protein [Ehrlichia ruminantium]QGR03715.1 hypothetical protein EDL80_04070 [Ehrlichia ruminantium]QGR04642.1 hypothetical protein EDL79_04080 [Ehrlichia ruminantium]